MTLTSKRTYWANTCVLMTALCGYGFTGTGTTAPGSTTGFTGTGTTASGSSMKQTTAAATPAASTAGHGVPTPPGGPGGVQKVTIDKDGGGYRLLVDGAPTMVLGMNWDYFPIGTNYSYSLWNQPDEFIKEALDYEMGLLQAMGGNSIRAYVGMPAKWITYIYEKYGIFTMLNHPMGRYGFSMDGAWIYPTDYSDPKQREYLKNEVVEMVKELKDTRGLLFWLLGNENNYGLYWSSTEIEDLPLDNQGDARAVFLYSLYGEITDAIHGVDDNHPVAIANGDLQFIDLIAKHAPNIDIMGSNVYRGKSSGDLFKEVEEKLQKPFVYTEFGSDAYNAKDKREDHVAQADYLHSLWQEIYEHSHNKGRVGNAIGGMTFQWSDGWWKYRQTENLDIQDPTASWANGAYRYDFVEGENNMNEEWFGICAKGQNDAKGHFKLYCRSSYYMLREAYRLDPYGPGTTLEVIRGHYNRIRPSDYSAQYDSSLALQKIDVLNMVRAANVVMELKTFTTGGTRLEDAARNRRSFDHMQSFYTDFELQPTNNVRARLSLNMIGNVAQNPIDEFFIENRGQVASFGAVDPNDPEATVNRDVLKVYQATFNWNSRYFDLEGFYRVGHGHWGYEGDFFGLYPEAYYQPTIDMFNANNPSGFVVTGKRFLEGFKVAFGPELWWGANPTIIGKYHRKKGNLEFSLMHQEDIAQLVAAGTSSVLPVPQTRKTTAFLGYTRGKFKLELGGIVAGSDRLGRQYFSVREAEPGTASYLDSGYYVLDDEIKWHDMLGGKVKLTYTGSTFNFYAQGGYRGLVADSGRDARLNFTGWGLTETGQGNHYSALAGALVNLGNVTIGPNFMYQRPLEGPATRPDGTPIAGELFDRTRGRFFPGVVSRNQFADPFWVRSNRETIGGELVITYDPTPATWLWSWDALQKEDAPFAGMINFTYRHLPTAMDSAVAIAAEGFSFAFPGSPPAKDLWEVRGRIFVNPTPKLRLVSDFYGGIAQANGDDARTIERFGVYGRMMFENHSLEAWFKVNDWGPYDYHRDFNFTFPIQMIADYSFGLTTPKWFIRSYTRLGVRGKLRWLDENSNRINPTQTADDRWGREWEVSTYVQISL